MEGLFEKIQCFDASQFVRNIQINYYYADSNQILMNQTLPSNPQKISFPDIVVKTKIKKVLKKSNLSKASELTGKNQHDKLPIHPNTSSSINTEQQYFGKSKTNKNFSLQPDSQIQDNEIQSLTARKKLNETKKKKKYIVCEYPNCKKRFLKASRYLEHRNNHHGIKNYKCLYKNCDKTFTRSYDLLRHFRIHLNLKPFQCLDCRRMFSRKDHLQMHEILHRLPGKETAEKQQNDIV